MIKNDRCRRLSSLSAQYNTLSQRLVEAELEKACLRYNLPTPLCMGDYQFLEIMFDRDSGTPISMAELSRLLGVYPSSATRRVRRLAKDGLVYKTSDEKDDRRAPVFLTDQGREFAGHMQDRMNQVVEQMYQGISDAQMDVVYDFMEHCLSGLRAAINEAEEEVL
ncbi:MAG: MarR family transcriptional regulator [Clostridia bacterium]|nr:MarR family transcriptional regulator [Clostridia bacterium]